MLMLVDGLAASLSLLALLVLKHRRPIAEPDAFDTALLFLALVCLFTVVLNARYGQYTNSKRLSHFAEPVWYTSYLLLASGAAALVFVVTGGFFLGSFTLSRVSLALGMAVFFVACVLGRIILAWHQRSLLMRGLAYKKALVLGTGRAAGEFRDFVTERPWLGVACVGILTYDQHATDCRETSGTEYFQATIGPTYESLADLDSIMCASGASEVVVALDDHERGALADIAKFLSLAHVPFRVLPSLFEQTYLCATALGYGELPVVDLEASALSTAEHFFKRVLDVTLASLLVIVGAIPGLLLMLAIKLESRGPVFYRQQRVGKNGRHFSLYKFRTMVENADQLLDQLADKNEKSTDGQLFKIKDDPRITRVGRLLRRWSIDELPQIINVYKGEMSLVGPRPPLPREVDHYEPQHYCRLTGLPGITGLWQVSGRSDLDFEDMVTLDRHYLNNWSLRLDLTIMLKTVAVVLLRKGAY